MGAWVGFFHHLLCCFSPAVSLLASSLFSEAENVLVFLACNVMKQALSYPVLYVSYISKRFCCNNIFHLFKIVGNLTEIFTGKIYF